ncbi:MAG: FAD:protein FMN transferase [Eggerthellaceae bacterium]|nr:FAD:protein FMN transferase [Eggerthellaceae bacterium]
MVNPGLAREGERAFFAFDTYNIIHANVSEDAVEACVDLCMRYNEQLSCFLPESEVSRLNASAGEPFACSEELSSMLQIAQALYEETAGAYNVAIGPVMDLWDFKAETLQLPNTAALERVLQESDLAKMELEGTRVCLPEGMRIDLGSIAKGFIVDRAAEFLLEQGATSGFLNFGGNILVLGPKSDGSPWRFGQQEPYANFGEKFWAILEATVGAFATSGGYERGITVGETRYHHLIDARTGYPVQHDLLTVTVYAGNATMADALSTSIFVLGAEAGLQLAQDLGVGALVRTEADKVLYTKGFPFHFAR